MNLRALRRRCEERLREIELPAPFSATSFCESLAERRDRPILLLPITAREGPFGLWAATRDTDYIFYESETSHWHQEHIILHEACHLLWDHERSLVSDEEVMRMLLPDLAPEMVHRVLRRSAYSEDDEQEAELLATLIAERTGELMMPSSTVPVRPGDPLDRLESILENSDGGGHA